MYDQSSPYDEYQCEGKCGEGCECSACWESGVFSDMEKILGVSDYLDLSGDLY